MPDPDTFRQNLSHRTLSNPDQSPKIFKMSWRIAGRSGFLVLNSKIYRIQPELELLWYREYRDFCVLNIWFTVAHRVFFFWFPIHSEFLMYEIFCCHPSEWRFFFEAIVSEKKLKNKRNVGRRPLYIKFTSQLWTFTKKIKLRFLGAVVMHLVTFRTNFWKMN